jgi:hypothetical protein
MASRDTELTANASGGRGLERWLERYTRYGVYGLLVGTAVCLAALFTNPVPDPSFPWFSLPSAYRLPIAQPRIEHWPVSYTVGIWLWIGCAPALFLRGYDRFEAHVSLGPATWLVALPTLAMIGLTTYCRFFWPKPAPATWNAPAYTFVCWVYCSTYDPLWSALAYGVAALGVVATVLAVRNSSRTAIAEGVFGVLALPLGMPALYDAYHRYSRE